jgi:PAS domain S-box-containing protein
VNPAFTRITGYTEADISGMTLHEAVHHKHPDGRPMSAEECPIVHAHTHLEPLRGMQETFVRKDGTHFPSVVALAPLEKHGKRVGGVLEFRDVTEEAARERALRFLVELNEATRPLTEPSEIMATATRLLGEHMQASRCAYAPVEDDEDHFAILGDYTRGCKSIVGRYPLSAFGSRALRELRAGRPYVVHDIDREAPPDEDLAAYRITEIQAVICVSLIKAGRMAALMAVHQTVPRQWTREEVDLVELAAEHCWAYIETAEANKQLRETAARLNLALATAKMGDWTWDAASDLMILSDRGKEILGLPPGAAITWSELCNRLDESDRERTDSAVERVRAEGGEYEQEYRIVLPEGIRWISAKGRAVLGRDGNVTGMLGVVQDITKQKQIEESLRLADRRKDEFLAMLGHELRNPLGSISNALYVLKRRMDDPATLKRYLEMVERQVALMSRLVGDMQDLSRIKTGKLMLRTEPVLLSQRMREAVETVSGVVAERSHELTVRVPKENLNVCADAARLTQIFSNLLSNAAKYTPPGGHIRFTAERENGEVVIRVADNGVGIAPEALPSIFELFSQSERTLGQSREGLGIGLSLVRGLVEMHGGAVTAHSPGLGRGSEFVVRLPAMPPDAAGETASTAEGSHE